jgi:excisionase family DNA binding protein
MTARPALPWPPALLSEPQAAAYIGVSATTLRGMVERGDAPAPVRVGIRRLYRRIDLDAWVASLPSEGEAAAEAESCAADRAFGCASRV